MPDLGYIVAGYAATAATVGGYRWRLAVRLRRARRYVETATGRRAA
ncbi:MAG TPA: hypothetical protein VLM05_01605 [Mycobacteriales bacterium]|nr:hypothetical protein [Mycobacteriales bacterium]